MEGNGYCMPWLLGWANARSVEVMGHGAKTPRAAWASLVSAGPSVGSSHCHKRGTSVCKYHGAILISWCGGVLIFVNVG